MGMIFNRTKDELLFHAKTFKQAPNYLVILISNKNSDRFEETIEVFENSVSSRVFLVNHTAFKSGVIVAASFNKNQIKLFSKNVENRYTLLKSISVDFSGSLDYFACWICRNKDIHSFISKKLERKYIFIKISEFLFSCINQCINHCCYSLPLLWLKHTQGVN